MALPKTSYLSKLVILYILILLEIGINATADNNDNPTAENWYPFVMIAVQLLIQLLLFLLIFAALSGTYLFQVGLLGVLISEFKGMLIAIPSYLVVYIAYAAVKIATYTSNGSNQDALWNSGLFVFFSIVQKIASMAYCIVLVSRFHTLGEAKWYQRKPWSRRFASTNPGSSSGGGGSSMATIGSSSAGQAPGAVSGTAPGGTAGAPGAGSGVKGFFSSIGSRIGR
jgi:Transmembrane protein 138